MTTILITAGLAAVVLLVILTLGLCRAAATSSYLDARESLREHLCEHVAREIAATTDFDAGLRALVIADARERGES